MRKDDSCSEINEVYIPRIEQCAYRTLKYCNVYSVRTLSSSGIKSIPYSIESKTRLPPKSRQTV